MNASTPASSPTRMIALGSAALTGGFSLIGFETIPDASAASLEQVLAELFRTQQKALVVVEEKLTRANGRWLKRVRSEGGRIVVVEVPPLHAPADYRPPVEDLVRSILGPSALEERE